MRSNSDLTERKVLPSVIGAFAALMLGAPAAYAATQHYHCKMTELAQGRRLVAPLNQHPWVMDIYFNEVKSLVQVEGPLTRTFSNRPIPTVVTDVLEQRIKFNWKIPGLRANERGMAGSYWFAASLNRGRNSIQIRVDDDRNHGQNPAVVQGMCHLKP